ncbi:MAG TPA: hypothetical protein VF798_03975, partial [Burkholderiaceae bacterium]
MNINPTSGRESPAAAHSASQEAPSNVPPPAPQNAPAEPPRGSAMSLQLATLSDMSSVRRSKSELNLPRRTETAIASSSRSLREQPQTVPAAADKDGSDWESVLDASVAAGEAGPSEGSQEVRMTPFGLSLSDAGAAQGERAARRSQSDIGLPRTALQDLPPLRSFREPPVSASAVLLDDTERSDDGAWNAKPAAEFRDAKGKGKLEDAQQPGGAMHSEEIVSSWLENAQLVPPRGHAAASSSGTSEQQIGLSKRSGTSLPVIAEQHEDVQGNAQDNAAAGPRASRGTFKGRLTQLIDNKKIPFTPPIQLARWDAESALEICHGLRNSQSASPSIPELSRLVALNFERAHADAIPEEKRGQRILPEGTKDDAYYREMIATFLKAAGVEDAGEVLESFKQAGTGGLHRQQVLTSSTAGGVVSGVAQIAASAHPIAKTALSAVQLALTAITTKLSFESGGRRLRNAGTEEVLP